jgi:PAS domain S-box-containing protein
MQRRTAAEAGFLKRERAEVALNSIGDGVISTDLDGTVTSLNAVAERMTGWTTQDAAGRPLSEVFHIIDATTRLRTASCISCVRRAVIVGS